MRRDSSATTTAFLQRARVVFVDGRAALRQKRLGSVQSSLQQTRRPAPYSFSGRWKRDGAFLAALVAMGQSLSEPITTKERREAGNDLHAYGLCSMQGYRPSMEDAHMPCLDLGDKGLSFFAVFDGHGGAEVAHYAAQHLHELVRSEPTFAGENVDLPAALRNAFMRIDRDLQTEEARLQINTILRTLSAKRAAEAASRAQVQQQQPPRPGYRPRPRYVSQGERDEPLQYDPGDVLRAGCTSVVALVDRNDLWCANAGDSRCVLSRRGKAVAMSFDHKPDDTEERARVERCGGRVQDGRINCGLNLSRALGDFDFKRHLGPKTIDGSAGGGGPLASDECVGAFPKAVIVPVNALSAAAAENVPAAASSSAAAAAAGLENASDVSQPGPTGGSTGEQQQQRQQWERVRLVDQHEQMVTCFPDVEHIRLSEEDEFIVLACDGIWDCLSNQEVVDFVRERLNRPSPRPSNSDIMSELLDVCLHTTAGPGSSVRIGTDNMSAILVIIKQPPTGEGSRSREAEDGEGNLYNTTTTASKDKEQEGGSSKRGASEFSSESTRVDDDSSGAKKTKP